MSDSIKFDDFAMLELSIRSYNCLTTYCGMRDHDPARKVLAIAQHPIKNFGRISFSDVCDALIAIGISKDELTASAFFKAGPALWRQSWLKTVRLSRSQ